LYATEDDEGVKNFRVEWKECMIYVLSGLKQNIIDKKTLVLKGKYMTVVGE